jgi:hypothetical protein
VKVDCDRNSDVTAARLQDMIEGFFNQWYDTWSFAIGGHNRKLYHHSKDNDL